MFLMKLPLNQSISRRVRAAGALSAEAHPHRQADAFINAGGGCVFDLGGRLISTVHIGCPRAVCIPQIVVAGLAVEHPHLSLLGHILPKLTDAQQKELVLGGGKLLLVFSPACGSLPSDRYSSSISRAISSSSSSSAWRIRSSSSSMAGMPLLSQFLYLHVSLPPVKIFWRHRRDRGPLRRCSYHYITPPLGACQGGGRENPRSAADFSHS